MLSLKKRLFKDLFLLIWTLALLVSPLCPLFCAAAEEESFQQKQISEQELKQAVALTIRRLKPLQQILTLAREKNFDLWLLGGSAASVAFYAKEQILNFGRVPQAIDFYDVFSFGQDIDLAVSGQDGPSSLENMNDLNHAIEANESLRFRLTDKSIWDLVNLYEHNGRGFIGNPDFFLQHSDSLSLGIVKLSDFEHEPLGAQIDWLPDYDQKITKGAAATEGVNLFVKSVIEGRINYIYRNTHPQNTQFLAGKNPPILSILRVLSKISRHQVRLSISDDLRLSEEVKKFLNSQPANIDKNYVINRAEKIIRQIYLSSKDPIFTQGLVKKFKVYEVIQKLGFLPEQIQGIKSLEDVLLRTASGFRLPSHQKKPVTEVYQVADGSIFEGTNLHGGRRPPVAVFPSMLKDYPQIKLAMEVWSSVGTRTPDVIARELINLAVTLKDTIHKLPLVERNKIIFPLSDMPHVGFDCRDSSLVAHMMFSLANIPSLISSTVDHTKVFLKIGPRGFLLNAHNSTVDIVDRHGGDYIQHFWVPHDLDAKTINLNLKAELFDRLLKSGQDKFTKKQLIEIFEHQSSSKLEYANHLIDKIKQGSLEHVFVFEFVKDILGDTASKIEPIANRALLKISKMSFSQIEDVTTTLKILVLTDHEHYLRVPENDLVVKILYRALKAYKKMNLDFLTSHDGYIYFFENTQHWISKDRKRAMIYLGSEYVNLSTMDADNSYVQLLRPNFEMLPYARRLWYRDGSKLFRSTGDDFYVPYLKEHNFSIESLKTVLEFFRYDADMNAKALETIFLKSNDDIKILKILEAQAVKSQSLKQKLEYSKLLFEFLESLSVELKESEKISVLIDEKRSRLSTWFRNFILNSKLFDEPMIRDLFAPLAKVHRHFIFKSLLKNKPIIKFERLYGLMNVDADFIENFNVIFKGQTDDMIHLIVSSAIQSADGDSKKIKVYIEQIRPLIEAVYLTQQSPKFFKLLTDQSHVLFEALGYEFLMHKLLSSQSPNTQSQHRQVYEFVKKMVVVFGYDELAVPDEERSANQIFKFAYLDVHGLLNANSLNFLLSQDFRLVLYLNDEQISWIHSRFVQNVFDNLVSVSDKKGLIFWFNIFSKHQYLFSDAFFDNHHDFLTEFVSHYDNQRLISRLLLIFVNNPQMRGLGMPPFVIRTMVSLLDEPVIEEENTVYKKRLDQAKKIVQAFLTRPPERSTPDSLAKQGHSYLPDSKPTDAPPQDAPDSDATYSKALCAKYFKQLR